MKNTIILFSILLLLATCKQDIVKKNSHRSVFEVFWHTMDERYVFFEEKNLNWDSIYNVYYPKIDKNTSDEELERYLQDIINYVGDGHVSIKMDEDEYISSKYDYYDNYDQQAILRHRSAYCDNFEYIGSKNAYLAQIENGILFLKIRSFKYEPHLEDLFALVGEYDYRNGIIVDIAGNSGGLSNYMREWASLFFEGTKTFLSKKNKTGKGHSDFSDYIPIDFSGQGYFADTIPIALAISGLTYSAGSHFTALMKELPNCKVFGEPTSGGGGSPTAIMLPNNWMLNYTRNKYYDLNKFQFEAGVSPDILVVGTVLRDGDNIVEVNDLVMDACIDYLLTK